MSTANYSVYAIPAFYILGIGPHLYSAFLIYRGTNGRFDNVNPRGTSQSEVCKKSLDRATMARVERAKAAHVNALECLPLFASAVICANMAGLERGLMNWVSMRLFWYIFCCFLEMLIHFSGMRFP